MEFSGRVHDLIHSPIGAAHRLVGLRTNDRPLLDLSQAAPAYPPAEVVADRIAEVARESDGGRYAPQPGLPALREAFAAELSADYRGDVVPANVLITAGCNQAFCIAATALSGPGDRVIVVEPFYFNHDMWLRVEGVEVDHVPLEVGAAERAITERTRAIVIVSPGNPTGVTIDPAMIRAFAELAKRHGVALVLDETYRGLRGTDSPAHELFADRDWGDTVVSLHSFSKDLAIPGYRVGALVSGVPMVTEALKVLDCVAISAPRIGQEAALTGLLHGAAWRRDQARRIAGLERLFVDVMSDRPGGFELVDHGAYFGWVRHPFTDLTTDDVVRMLVLEHDVLVIPGTAFTATDESMLRLSFANLVPEEVGALRDRLEGCGRSRTDRR